MDILKLGQALQNTNPLVQVQAALRAGLYDVELLIVDSAGEQAKATLSFEILGRTPRPPVPRPVPGPLPRPPTPIQ